MRNKKITKKDLQHIVEMARDNFINFNKGELSDGQFLAKCYIEAAAHILNLGSREYEERIPHEPNED